MSQRFSEVNLPLPPHVRQDSLLEIPFTTGQVNLPLPSQRSHCEYSTILKILNGGSFPAAASTTAHYASRFAIATVLFDLSSSTSQVKLTWYSDALSVAELASFKSSFNGAPVSTEVLLHLINDHLQSHLLKYLLKICDFIYDQAHRGLSKK